MTAERIYRILLKAYPAQYRRKYEEVMAQCFRDQLRAANTVGKRAGLWLRLLADFALSIPVRYVELILPSNWRIGYTQDARRAVFYARCEAILFNHTEVSLEDFLVGVLRSDKKLATAILGPDGVAAIVRAIEAHNANPRKADESLPPPEVIAGAGRKKFPFRRAGRPLPLSEECKSTLVHTAEMTRDSGMDVTPAHFLKAILQHDTRAARLLRERGDVSRLDAAPE